MLYSSRLDKQTKTLRGLVKAIGSVALMGLLMLNSISCDKGEETPVFSGQINLRVQYVGAASAEMIVDISAASSPVPIREVFVVYGESPGLTENSPNKIALPPTGGTASLHGLKANTRYYGKAFIFDEDGVTHHQHEISWQTTQAQIISAPRSGRRNSEIIIVGNFFSPEKSDDKVFFGEIEAEVTSVIVSGSFEDSLKVIVPEELDDAPVQLSVNVGGVQVIYEHEFLSHNISIIGFTPETVHEGDTVRVFGENFSADSKIGFSDGKIMATEFHETNEGNYLAFVVRDVYSGTYDLLVRSGEIEVVADKQLTVLPGYWINKSLLMGTDPNPKREYAASFVIGNKAYLGLGRRTSGVVADFWEYNMDDNPWTRKNDFPGAAREKAVSFSIDGKGYVATGEGTGLAMLQDVWEYNPQGDSWVQKNNFPGSARSGAVAVVVADKAYVGLGRDSNNLLNDWWEYDPSNDSWVQVADFPGSAREFASAFEISGKAFVGIGNENGLQVLSDFWEYNPSSDTWVQRTDYGGGGRSSSSTFVIGGQGYVTAGFDNLISPTRTCWRYDPGADSWTKMAVFQGSPRWSAVGFSSLSKGYIVTGSVNDVWTWEFDPTK